MFLYRGVLYPCNRVVYKLEIYDFVARIWSTACARLLANPSAFTVGWFSSCGLKLKECECDRYSIRLQKQHFAHNFDFY